MQSMRFLAVSAVVSLGLFAGVAPASALNPGAVAPLAKTAPSNVVQADYYCGPGWYLDRWGDCRPYGYGYGYGWYGYGYPYYRYRHYNYHYDHDHYRYRNYGYRNFEYHGHGHGHGHGGNNFSELSADGYGRSHGGHGGHGGHGAMAVHGVMAVRRSWRWSWRPRRI